MLYIFCHTQAYEESLVGHGVKILQMSLFLELQEYIKIESMLESQYHLFLDLSLSVTGLAYSYRNGLCVGYL